MQQSVGDAELLRLYVRARDQQAFAELVRRHVDMVYTSARRQVREPSLAEDVTQQVFIVLAARAKSVKPDTVLGSWLLAVARNESRNALKRLARRQRHERSAAEMKSREPLPSPENQEDRWESLEPLLDEALADLNEGDRHAVVLRYFRNKSHREGAEALGISEPSMRQRVHRGVERMRAFLVSRGVKVTAAALASGLTSNAVALAPAGLAEGVAAQAIATTTAGGLTIQKGALLAVTKSNAIAVAAVAVLLVAGAAVAGRYALTRADDQEPSQKPVAAAQIPPTKPAQAAANAPPPPAQDPDFNIPATRGPKWKPGGHPMYVPINALGYDDKRGTRDGFDHISFIEAGNWVRYADVELADGDNTAVFAVSCDKRYAGKVVTLHLGDPESPIAGRLIVKATPGTFEQQSAIVEGKKGKRDVYLKFPDGGGFNIRTFKFTAGVRDATKTITASSHAAASTGVLERDTRVANIGDGEWLRYDSIDFGEGVDTFQADGSHHTSWGPGAMQVRIDAVDGPVIAQQTIDGGATEGWVEATFQCAAKPVKGVHDVYLTFTGGEKVIDLNSFRFGRRPSPATRPSTATRPIRAKQP